MTGPEAFPRFSVIIASRGRPEHLRRTLRAVRQLDYPSFEIVVVGDAGAVAVSREVHEKGIKVAAFDQPNLSAARNLGVTLAAGDVCAFIDDDAVPEPMWLRQHAAGLGRTGAAASVGYVRGPDGIRFQSRFTSIDMEAETHEEPADGEEAFVPGLRRGRAVKLVGTNMAVRRDVLTELGGFDPAFSYFLEDGDLSLRLSLAGLQTAVVPLAEVHHALAGSPVRTRRGVPKTLVDIGRSTAIFLRRHPGADPQEIFGRIMSRERRRLLAAMVRGTIEPHEVPRLAQTLEDGWRAGLRADLPKLHPMRAAEGRFEPFSAGPAGHLVIACRALQFRAGLARARQFAASGNARASLYCLFLTGLAHTVRYTDDGVWLQTGGQFVETGLSRRRFRWCRFASRIEDETRRVAKRRGLNEGVRVEKAGFATALRVGIR